MTSFRILPRASEELEAAVAYYNSQQAELGTAFLSEFEETIERIVDLPLPPELFEETCVAAQSTDFHSLCSIGLAPAR